MDFSHARPNAGQFQCSALAKPCVNRDDSAVKIKLLITLLMTMTETPFHTPTSITMRGLTISIASVR